VLNATSGDDASQWAGWDGEEQASYAVTSMAATRRPQWVTGNISQAAIDAGRRGIDQIEGWIFAVNRVQEPNRKGSTRRKQTSNSKNGCAGQPRAAKHRTSSGRLPIPALNAIWKTISC